MISVHCFSKGFLILFGQIYFNLLPPELNALRNFIMLIHKLRAEDLQVYTCWSWTPMVMAFSLTKFRVLAVDENGYAPGPKKDIILYGRGRK